MNMKVKNRLLGQKADQLLEMFPAVAIVGPRQCGKSTLVQALRPDWNYYDLERPDDYQLISSDPLGFFERRKGNTIIDEAQQFPELFQVLRNAIDRDRGMAGRYLLTGSSSPDIVRGLSESLAGRIATVELWPFKTVEFYEKPLPDIYRLITSRGIQAQDLTEVKPALTSEQVYDQWLKGGYPEPRIKGEQHGKFHGLWMDEYFSDYIRRDIQRLFPRINPQVFRLFIQTLSFHSGNIINQSVIARALEVSSVTAKSYLEILHDTFVWRNLRSYGKNRLKKVKKASKGFFRDQGILHHLLKISDLDSLLIHPTAGTSFEAFIIEEIIRGIQCMLEPGIDFHYYRTRDRSEVDLVIEGPFGLVPIEIKLGHKITQRDLTGLKSFLEDTQAPFGILVSNAERTELLTDRIIHLPATCF